MLHNVVVAGCGCSAMWCGKPHMCNGWGMGWIEKAKSRQFIGYHGVHSSNPTEFVLHKVPCVALEHFIDFHLIGPIWKNC